jgi:hypothetical protein
MDAFRSASTPPSPEKRKRQPEIDSQGMGSTGGLMKYFRRKKDDFQSTSTPPSPETKRPGVQSAIRAAISSRGKGSSHGLMKFFKPCTKEEYDMQRFTEEHHTSMEKEGPKFAEAKARQEAKTREGERLRQQKHRGLKRQGRINRGERTPEGTKRKVDLLSLYGYLSKSDIRTILHFVVDLKDSPTKKAKHSMAELLRPGRAEMEVACNKNKKTAG